MIESLKSKIEEGDGASEKLCEEEVDGEEENEDEDEDEGKGKDGSNANVSSSPVETRKRAKVDDLE